MSDKLRISQCMIVKDEEQNIERALSWGREILWEQIVVDTGSTDRTVELAKAMGAKVYHVQWTDDFAAAKNYALDQAKGDWIAFLDADEYPDQETVERLIPALEECARKGQDALGAAMADLDEKGNIRGWATLVRFFRNDPLLRYRFPIHEQLRFTDGRLPRAWDATDRLTICHTGYCGQAYEEKKRSGRNRRLICRVLAENPDSYELLGYLGDDFYAEGDMEKALECYEKSIRGMPPQLSQDDQRSASTYSRLLRILISSGDTGELERIHLEHMYHEAASRFPQDGDYDYMLGIYHMGGERYEQGGEFLRKALDKIERYGIRNRSLFLAANLEGAYEGLAVCDYRCGRYKEAVQTTSSLLKQNPYHMKMLYILLQCFSREQAQQQPRYAAQPAAQQQPRYADQVADFLSRLYDFSSLKDKLFVRRAAHEADYRELEQVMADMFDEDERRLLSEYKREETVEHESEK